MEKGVARTVSEGALWLSSGAIVLKILTVINILYILRNLSVYEYGVVELVLSVIPMLEPFLVPGLSTAVVADMSVEKGKGNLSGVKLLVDNFFKLQFLLCIVAFVIVFFGANIIAGFYSDNVANFFRVVSFTFLLAPFRSMFSIFFSVHLKFFQQTVVTLSEETAKLVFMFIFFTFLVDKSYGLLLAIICSQIVTLIIAIPPFIRIYRKLPSYAEKVPFWYLLRDHGKWSIFASYLSTLAQNAQLWIIKVMVGTEAVGLFAVAQGLIGHVMSFLPLDKILSPLVPQYVHDEERFDKLLRAGIKYQLLGSIVLSVGAAIFAPFVIAIIVPKYLPAVPLFEVLLIAVPILSFVPVFNSVFFAFKKQKDLFFANAFFKAGLMLLLTPLLIYFFGVNGIAYTGVIVPLLFVLERYRVVRKILPHFKILFSDLFMYDAYDALIVQQLLRIFRLKRS